jgi:acetolactate synthase-1/2/3 large subunit
MKRVSDIVADLLVAHGISHVFMVTGGGAMHLNDAFGRHPGLTPVFCHHEQACSMAAESYGRLSNRLAAVNVTTGPGGINSLNGVFGAFVDSVGMVVVSGQVKRETMMGSYDLGLRQLGDQEVDIVAMVATITKSAEVLDDPNETRFVVERALWTARHGRPGPVWIDIPIDVQSALVDESTLRSFDPLLDAPVVSGTDTVLTDDGLLAALTEVAARLAAAERPVIIAGSGVRLSGAYETFLRVVAKLGVPVATAFNAHDLIWNSHPLYVGRPGTVGDRGGNFAVQNADFILILGCRMNIRQISYNWTAFARAAFTVMIDIDQAELSKPTLSVDLPVRADLAEALALLEAIDYKPQPSHLDYLRWCRERLDRYPVVLPEYWKQDEPVNPYCFVQTLFEELGEDDVVITADGTACVVTFQGAYLKPGQRLYSNSGSASMGYDLPAAIGAHYASDGRRVICLAGDGSIMMNLQELQTIAGNQLPIKLVVLNNNGYSSIRQTQRSYFPDNAVGCGPESGLTFPDFGALGAAFGFAVHRCFTNHELADSIRDLLVGEGPQMLEVMLDPEQPFAPKLASRQLEDGRMVSSPLEDLAPFLSRTELAENMLIPLLED